MAKKYQGTIEFTERKVGPGCDNIRRDVETVQQLLRAAGELSAAGAVGGWGPQSTAALQSFRNRYGTSTQRTALCLEPNDELLLLMAQKANLVIPLSGFRGMVGVQETHNWLERNQIRYNEGAQYGRGNRALWGVRNRPAFVVQTISGAFGAARIEMDCTIYVNLMVSLYLKGVAHSDSYVADCSKFGGSTANHLARERYGFPLVRREAGGQSLNYFSTAAEIADATKTAPASLYVLEVGEGRQGGAVKHMALLSGSTVYECTMGQAGSSCISRSLVDFMLSKVGKIIYLFGPR